MTMPQSRREQKRVRHEAKRKAKRKAARGQLSAHTRKAMLRASLAWPVLECWANETWQDTAHLTQLLVVRQNPATGEVYVGLFLVDRGCLGVKNAHTASFMSVQEFRRTMLARLRQQIEFVQIDFNLVAKIVQVGLEYSAQFGFRPHRDFQEASILLEDAHPDSVDVEITVGGPDGKPMFMSGPYDDVPRIMARLMRQLGSDGFTHLIGIDHDRGIFLDKAETLDWGVDDGEEIVLTDGIR